MPVFSAIAIASAYVAAAATAATAAAGITISAATAAAIGNFVVGTTLSMITSALFAPRVRQPSTKYSQVVNQEIPERLRGYGTFLLGGARGEWRVKDGYLFEVILAHTGEVNRLVEYWIEDQRVDVDAQNRVISEPYNWKSEDRFHVSLMHRLGQPDQVGWDGSDRAAGMDPTDPFFMGLSEAFPSLWSRGDNFAGIACIFAILRSPKATRIGEMFPQGAQTAIRGVWELSKVFDPRTGITAWSDNAGLCIADYLTHSDGYRLDRAKWIDEESFAAFADVCDEDVPLKGGGTQKRYTLNGCYSLQDKPADVLDRMRAACDAELYITPAGKIGIRGGKWEAPTVTITRDQILERDLQSGVDKFQTFNQLKITFTSPKAKYQTDEATQWVDPEDQAKRGVVASEFNVDMANTSAQVRRLAKIYRAKENPRWYGTITTNLVGIKARFERIIRIVYPEMGIDGPFLVESHGFSGDLTKCVMQVRWLGPEAYEWDAETEESEEAPEIIEDEPDVGLPVPTDLALSIESVGTPVAQRVVVATVAEPDRDELELQAQITTGARWDTMSVADGAYVAASGPVLTSQTYRVRTRFKGPSGAVSEWTDPDAANASITVPAA